MKILITGATGLVGSKLVDRLISQGHSVHILTRKSLFGRTGIEYFRWEDYNQLPPKEAFIGIDSIVNLMGENIGDHRWTESQKKKIYESRVIATRNIVKIVGELSIKNISFINASAIGIYQKNLEICLDENDSFFPDDFLSKVCFDWESALNDLDSSVRKVIIRTGVVLSKDGGALKKMLLPFSLGLGGTVGKGSQVMSWIHIDDLVNIYYNAICNENYRGIFNAVAPGFVNNYDFTKWLGNILHRPTIFPLPSFVVKIIFGEMGSILLDSQKIKSTNLPLIGYEFVHKDLNNVLK